MKLPDYHTEVTTALELIDTTKANAIVFKTTILVLLQIIKIQENKLNKIVPNIDPMD